MRLFEMVKKWRGAPFLFQGKAPERGRMGPAVMQQIPPARHVLSHKYECFLAVMAARKEFEDIQRELEDNWRLILQARERLDMLERMYGKG